MLCYIIFFFKHKTSYDMRISDWSSDVCSSDLLVLCLLFSIVGCAMHRLAGKTHAIISVMLLALTMPVLIQFAPMRIDHHGWKIIMAALALYGSLLPCPRRSGIVSGIALDRKSTRLNSSH